jgi:hypothetical protein
MKLLAVHLEKRVHGKAPALKQRGLTPHQGVLHAFWSDERNAYACVSMVDTNQVIPNTDAARRFVTIIDVEIRELRAALLEAGPMICAACDGRFQRAAGTKARLGDLTRFLTYHQHHGSRRQARQAQAGLKEEERNWRGADLDAARAASPTKLDFAELLPETDRLRA